MRIRSLAAIAILAAGFAASAFAAGNSPSKSVYHPHAAQVQGVLGTSTHPATTRGATARVRTGANLPFTGFDLAFLAAASVVLLATGYSLRRLTCKPPEA